VASLDSHFKKKGGVMNMQIGKAYTLASKMTESFPYDRVLISLGACIHTQSDLFEQTNKKYRSARTTVTETVNIMQRVDTDAFINSIPNPFSSKQLSLLRYNPNRKENNKNPETSWLQALEQTLNQSHAHVAVGLFEALEWFQEQKITPYILSHRPKEVINLYLTKISGSDRDSLLGLIPSDRHITCDLVEPSRRNVVLNGARVHADIYPDLQRIKGFKPETTLVIENHLKSTLDATENGYTTIGYTDDRCDVVCADGIRFAGAVTTFTMWDEVQDAVRSSLYSQKTGPAPQNAAPC
jgi:hypothetical protein